MLHEYALACTSPATLHQAAEEAAKASKEKEVELRTGNPLLAMGQDANFAIKRRCVRVCGAKGCRACTFS